MPKLDLRRLILLLSMTATCLVLAHFFYATYQIQRELLIKQTLETNRNYSVKLADVTENFLNASRKQISYSASVVGKDLHAPQRLASEVDRIRLQADTFNSVYIVDAEGRLLAISPRGLQVEGTLINSENARSPAVRQRLSVSKPYLSTLGRLVIAITHPLHDAQGNYLGFIGGSIYLKEASALHDMLGEHYYRDASYLYVTNSEGQLLYHKDPQRVGEIIVGNPAIQAVVEGQAGSLQLVNSEGIEMLAGFAPIKSVGWGIIAQRPLQATLEELNVLMLRMLLNIVPFFLLVMLAIWWLSRIISLPLWNLARGVQKPDTYSAQDAIRGVKSWYFEVAQLKQSILVGLEMLNHKIGKLNIDSMTDPLTGLLNRRGAQLAIDEWQACAQPFAVIFLDIDHFKKVNDAYGHAVGDLTLQFLAQQMRHVGRSTDILCRSGGEEFMLLLPDTSLTDALQIAECLRATMASTASPTGQPVTLSLGIAHYPSSHGQIEAVLRSADQALYLAKNQGRNRVVVAQPAP